MVFYRKYRPQTLEELIGQDGVKKILLDSFSNNKLSHAYLFVGPRGTGKTSTARILAKMMNCLEKNPPCNKCETCLSITDGSNLDLIEIDAASNRGIDDVRSLRENIRLSPSGQGKKVYIVDEVHMLTTEAFNALLKTLEEPPEHAIFILATTEVNKIPATILSRVTRVDFKLASTDDLVKTMEMICKGEGVEVEDGALLLLAKKADGSFRDGVKLLDQLASSGKITVQSVSDGLAIVPFDGLLEILESLSKKDIKSALTAVNTQISVGVGVKDLTLQLMEILRELVLVQNGLNNLVEKDYGDLANTFSMKDLVDILDKLQLAFEKQKFASIISLPLELAIIDACSQQVASIQTPKVIPTEKIDIYVAPVAPAPEKIDTVSEQVPSISVPQISLSSDSDSEDRTILEEKWQFILESIRPYNFSLEALLRSTKIKSAEGGVVIFEVPYAFHQRILEAPKSKDHLETVLSEVLQKPIKVATTLGVRPQRIEDVANIEVAADDEIITLAADIFNGKLVD